MLGILAIGSLLPYQIMNEGCSLRTFKTSELIVGMFKIIADFLYIVPFYMLSLFLNFAQAGERSRGFIYSYINVI